MGQTRFKGIECDNCGVPSSIGLRLTMSVRTMYTLRPKERHVVDDADFYADFCSRKCMRAFLDKCYFETNWEVLEDERGDGQEEDNRNLR